MVVEDGVGWEEQFDAGKITLWTCFFAMPMSQRQRVVLVSFGWKRRSKHLE